MPSPSSFNYYYHHQCSIYNECSHKHIEMRDHIIIINLTRKYERERERKRRGRCFLISLNLISEVHDNRLMSEFWFSSQIFRRLVLLLVLLCRKKVNYICTAMTNFKIICSTVNLFVCTNSREEEKKSIFSICITKQIVKLR